LQYNAFEAVFCRLLARTEQESATQSQRNARHALRSVLPALIGTRGRFETTVRRKELFAAALALIESCATDHGLVLAIDDWQWSDLDSHGLLAYLVEHGTAPVLLANGRARGSSFAAACADTEGRAPRAER
jgi:predicted ATPase